MQLCRRCKCRRMSFRSRKRFLIFILTLGCVLYAGPNIFRYLFEGKPKEFDQSQRCMYYKRALYELDAINFDVNFQHVPPEPEDIPYLPFVGNGKIGVHLDGDGLMYLKHSRVLSVPVPFLPSVAVKLDGIGSRDAIVTHYTSGLLYRFQCFSKPTGTLEAHTISYAHRIIPSIFVQEMKVTNPTDEDITGNIKFVGAKNWEGSKLLDKSFEVDKETRKFVLITGKVSIPGNSGQYFAVAIFTSKVPESVHVRARTFETLLLLTSVHYTGPIGTDDYEDAIAEAVKQSEMHLKTALSFSGKKLKHDHIAVWQQLWRSGFGISYSKAANAVNGNGINATVYYMLSNTRSPLHETDISKARQQELATRLSQPDRCYDGHTTLQASTLWSHLSTLEDMVNVIKLWKMTLVKQGCEALLQAGADGILQAMILSFGALKFSNHHLELGLHPKHLHRDYHFRRISYGNATHLNITILVGEDNKAVLYVALDRSDKTYYACDGGCLDTPVKLGPQNQQFPVKLTDPTTAILYITSDKQHMEELKHVMHVEKVVEAPAHEHHIIALHRHGHHLGGLPPLFWISIIFLVLVFHLFLVKLICNEYCVNQDKFRGRYAL